MAPSCSALMCHGKPLAAALTATTMLELSAIQAWVYNYIMAFPNT